MVGPAVRRSPDRTPWRVAQPCIQTPMYVACSINKQIEGPQGLKRVHHKVTWMCPVEGRKNDTGRRKCAALSPRI